MIHRGDIGETVSMFVADHYANRCPPKLLITPTPLFDGVEEWLQTRRESAVEVRNPSRGDFVTLQKLAAQNAEIKNTSRTLNYGSDKVRFINMVKVGSHVRLNRTIISCDEMKNGGFRVVNKCELEIKDDTKPAFIAETISLVFP